MLKIRGGQQLSGTVRVSGSKNASLPIIAASLYLKKVELRNVPRIGDVLTFLDIIRSMNVKVEFEGNTLRMDMTGMSLENFDTEKIKKIRVGILLIPVLLDRFGSVDIPYPGGCNIGKRSIDEHIRGFVQTGFVDGSTESQVKISGAKSQGEILINASFMVTATENLITANVLRSGDTRIVNSAIEPHVMNLVEFWKKAGAEIEVNYDHSIVIRGVSEIRDEIGFDIIHDYIESGTFVIFGALCADDHIDILNARIGDLTTFLEKCREAGVRFEILPEDTLRVYRSTDLRAIKLQTNIFPGFPTDLQSPFSILLTQAEGISRIQEIMFEGRLNYLVEIEKMKGHPALLNPHEALLFGKTRLVGTTVSSWDLRAGVAMIIAGLIAKGETYITNVEYIERGYEDIISKLEGLGTIVERVDSGNV